MRGSDDFLDEFLSNKEQLPIVHLSHFLLLPYVSLCCSFLRTSSSRSSAPACAPSPRPKTNRGQPGGGLSQPARGLEACAVFSRPVLGVFVSVTVTWVVPRTSGVDGEALQPGGECWRRRLLRLRV